jgi:hypothetical protein
VYALCDLVCGNIARQHERAAQDRRVFSRAGASRTARRQGSGRG